MICLRSKAFSFKCNDKNTTKLKSSKLQVKITNFDEYFTCVFGSVYQKESKNFVIRSKNHETYPQKLIKSHYLLLIKNGVI